MSEPTKDEVAEAMAHQILEECYQPFSSCDGYSSFDDKKCTSIIADNLQAFEITLYAVVTTLLREQARAELAERQYKELKSVTATCMSMDRWEVYVEPTIYDHEQERKEILG